MDELIRILSERVWGYSWSAVMTEVLQTIIERQWSTMRMREIMATYRVKEGSVSYKQECVDVAIKYVEACLEDDVLTQAEINGMSLLKRMLYIEEGDFYKYGKKDQVKALIAKQLNRMYQDGEISKEDELSQVELQGLFNLSYREFEAIKHEVEEENKKPEYIEEETVKPFYYDPLFGEVARWVVEHQDGYVSRIQRHFEIGFMRAGKIADQLEAAGIISPVEKQFGKFIPREVLIKDIPTLEKLLEEIM